MSDDRTKRERVIDGIFAALTMALEALRRKLRGGRQ